MQNRIRMDEQLIRRQKQKGSFAAQFWGRNVGNIQSYYLYINIARAHL
jgi:hypothetical protein